MTEKSKAMRVVAALLFRGRRILICQRRADGAFPLKWEFPGGKVEEGESDVDALHRELREELAIEITQCEFVCEHQHTYSSGLAVSLHFYKVTAFEGEAKNRVFEQIVWADIAELDRFDFLEGDRPIIARLTAGVDRSSTGA